MKRFLKISSIVAVIILIAGFSTYKIMDNVLAYNEAHGKAVHSESNKADTTAKIGGVQYSLGIDENSSEMEVIEVMHKMTHQKVEAEEKWGAIEMTPKAIDQNYDIVSKSNFEHKNILLEMLNRWKKGDFSQIVDDHNWFWSLQDGTIGESTRALTSDEEQEFIANNFSNAPQTSETLYQ